MHEEQIGDWRILVRLTRPNEHAFEVVNVRSGAQLRGSELGTAAAALHAARQVVVKQFASSGLRRDVHVAPSDPTEDQEARGVGANWWFSVPARAKAGRLPWTTRLYSTRTAGLHSLYRVRGDFGTVEQAVFGDDGTFGIYHVFGTHRVDALDATIHEIPAFYLDRKRLELSVWPWHDIQEELGTPHWITLPATRLRGEALIAYLTFLGQVLFTDEELGFALVHAATQISGLEYARWLCGGRVDLALVPGAPGDTGPYIAARCDRGDEATDVHLFGTSEELVGWREDEDSAAPVDAIANRFAELPGDVLLTVDTRPWSELEMLARRSAALSLAVTLGGRVQPFAFARLVEDAHEALEPVSQLNLPLPELPVLQIRPDVTEGICVRIGPSHHEACPFTQAVVKSYRFGGEGGLFELENNKTTKVRLRSADGWDYDSAYWRRTAPDADRIDGYFLWFDGALVDNFPSLDLAFDSMHAWQEQQTEFEEQEDDD